VPRPMKGPGQWAHRPYLGAIGGGCRFGGRRLLLLRRRLLLLLLLRLLLRLLEVELRHKLLRRLLRCAHILHLFQQVCMSVSPVNLVDVTLDC